MSAYPCLSGLMGVPIVQEEEFLQEALGWYSKLKSWSANNYAYDWDNKAPGLHVLFAQIFPSDMMQYSINAQTCAPRQTIHIIINLPACSLFAFM